MEGLPVVLMEAMALEKPVIAPNLAGIPDMIQHGENGLLFLPADWTSLKTQMCTMLTDPEAMLKMAKAGRDTIEQDFEISQAVIPLLRSLQLTPIHKGLSVVSSDTVVTKFE
jgi:glycosyltransferase involved in cell wall biosynthesis